MIRAPRFRVGALLALLAIPGIASAWSGVQHIQITRYAARNLPPEMAGFREFAHPMALPSIYPDLWRLADLDEAPRHYFEPDRLPEDFDCTALSSDPAIAFSEQIPIRRDIIGDAPWAIYDLMNQMSEAMRTNDWMWAARCGATLSHYAGDLHVPLHTTRNYNGQESWQHGIHTRWEADMVKAFLRTDDIEPRPAEYLENPFQAIFEWTAESAVCAREVLKADLIAKRAAGGQVETESYYLKLWELTGDMAIERISAAAHHVASLWYTAWVNAGKPAIPEPFDELPTLSVHSGVGIDYPEQVGPHAFAKERTFDWVIWITFIIFGLVVIISSIQRSIQSRKNRGT